MFCVSCGLSIESGWSFCGGCGARVTDAGESAPTSVPAPAAAPSDGEPDLGPVVHHPEVQPDMVDLTRYHDLTRRLGAYSTDGGDHLRGDREDVGFVEDDLVLAEGEYERVRLAGFTQLFGNRTTSVGNDSVGLVLEGGATIIVTSERLVVLARAGASQLGQIREGVEIHSFVMPWDLVDTISIPARRTMLHRVAGNRDITIQALNVFVTLRICPVKQAEVDRCVVRISDDDAMRYLVEAAIDHRVGTSPSGEHPRLHAVKQGRYVPDDDELIAWITSEEDTDIPVHLHGRLVIRE